MKVHTARNVLIAAFACLVAGGAIVVIVTYIANRSISKEQKLKLVLQTLFTSLENDEIDDGFRVVDGRVVFEGRNHPSQFGRKRVITPVEGADAATFRTFDQVFLEHGPRLYYGVDKNHAYLGHVTLPADALTFEASSPGHISDPWHGGRYFDGPYSTAGWNRDAKDIYYGNKILEAADPETFQDLKFAHYAKDAHNVYCGRKIIAGADPESLTILGAKYLNFFPVTVENPTGHGPIARDKEHFYLYTDIVKRDGPWLRGGCDR
jgi:hypothetical protein